MCTCVSVSVYQWVSVFMFRRKTKPVCLDVGGCVRANLLCLAGGHLYGPAYVLNGFFSVEA